MMELLSHSRSFYVGQETETAQPAGAPCLSPELGELSYDFKKMGVDKKTQRTMAQGRIVIWSSMTLKIIIHKSPPT
jgi:hypothetical protein